MAQMIPSALKEIEVSTAEYTLYQALQTELDDTYTIFHSVAWQAIGRNGRPQDGEADFVITHPENGVLVMEVKGGIVEWNPHKNRWTSETAAGKQHVVKDPFRQARVSKFTLITLLGQKIGETRHLNFGHAVAFPEVYVGVDGMGADKPREIILDMADVADLGKWTRQAMRYWRGGSGRKESGVGETGMAALERLLGRTHQLRPALWGQFQQEQRALMTLTNEQFMVLDMLNRQRQAAISGVAGSGKTVLAVEKAIRLAEQGFHVLLTCYNKNLAASWRKNIGHHANLHIAHFHQLCRELTGDAGMTPVPVKDKTAYYNDLLPTALLDATDVLETRYDAIVVDEGQDFHDNWWVPLQSLLTDPDDGILYIFYDDNQQIYRWADRPEQSETTVGTPNFPIATEPFALTVNCRNTQTIHEQVSRFHKSALPVQARGPVGRPIEIQLYTTNLQVALTDTLHHLTETEQIPPNEIAILTPLSRKKSELWLSDRFRGLHFTDQLPTQSNEIYCNTVHAFKGLESTVVILAELERGSHKRPQLDPLLYVACSRARHHLIVLLSEDAPPTLKKRFIK